MKRFMHTGTDCSHQGEQIPLPNQGICWDCRNPMGRSLLPMTGGNQALKPLSILLDPAKGLKGLLYPLPKLKIHSGM